MKYTNTLSQRVGRIATALGAFLVVIATVISMSASCFATEATGETTLTLTQAATTYNFDVTESIEMSAAANSTTLTIGDFTITNNSSVGKIGYDLIATGVEGYTVVADSQDFDSMSVTAKKFSIVANTKYDLSTKYENVGEVDSCKGTNTVTFTGHVSPTASALNADTAGKLTATISWM